jgi:hypothetical protein
MLSTFVDVKIYDTDDLTDEATMYRRQSTTANDEHKDPREKIFEAPITTCRTLSRTVSCGEDSDSLLAHSS